MELDIGNGVAASCSTHSDLTKLILGENDYNSGEEDEEPCPMDIEDDDIEICFEAKFFFKGSKILEKFLRISSQWDFYGDTENLFIKFVGKASRNIVLFDEY